MSPYLVLAILGGLLSIFGTAEWLLLRLEEMEERKGRAICFWVIGGLCLTSFAIISRYPGLVAHSFPENGPVSSLVSTLDRGISTELAIIQKILQTEQAPSLTATQEARQELLNARTALAKAYPLDSPIRPLVSQADTLLGAAYHTMGEQWLLVKGGRWQSTVERQKITDGLRQELERYHHLKSCTVAGEQPCKPQPPPAEIPAELRQFLHWFHPLMIELIRFQESDPTLINSSPAEVQRLREVFQEGLHALSGEQMAKHPRPVIIAAEQMLRSADKALSLENAAVTTGQWHSVRLTQTYLPLNQAVEQYIQLLQCWAQTPCIGTSKH